MPQSPLNVDKSLPAAILAWLIPGAGHYYLGYRRLATTFFLAISVPFLAGLLMGGIKTCIDPKGNSWLFAAEICVGGYTLGGVGVSSIMGVIPEEKLTQYYSFYPTSEVAQIYLSVAGLLNILAILDVLMRAQTGGMPVFYHETMGTAVRRGGVWMTALAGLLALGIPFIQPLPIAGWMRLWMFLPLAFCVAVVYRATRARETDRILRSAFFSFVNISVGMVLIALAAYGIHWLALRWTA